MFVGVGSEEAVRKQGGGPVTVWEERLRLQKPFAQPHPRVCSLQPNKHPNTPPSRQAVHMFIVHCSVPTDLITPVAIIAFLGREVLGS